jgi:hypothetical protein
MAAEVATRRRIIPNRILFPRNLREAIPDLPTCIGRELVIDSISGHPTHTPWFGDGVELRLITKETGKLKGEFKITVHLSPDAARGLAETLTQLADQAKSSRN